MLRRERNRRKGVRSARTRREKNTEAPRVRRYSPPEEQLPWSAIRQMPYQSPDKVVGYKFAFFGFVLGGKCTKNIFAGTIKCSFFSKNLSTRAVGRFYTYLLYIRKRHDGSGTGCGDGQKKSVSENRKRSCVISILPRGGECRIRVSDRPRPGSCPPRWS